MNTQPTGAGSERIVGELQLDPDEVPQISREATADSRWWIVFQSSAIVFAVIAVAGNLSEGEERLRSFAVPIGTGLLGVFSLVNVLRQRRTRIAGILEAQTSASGAISYLVAPGDLVIHSAIGATRLSWGECRSFAESAHAFVIYTSRVVPEILYKRAFRQSDLPLIRERLGANIQRRPTGRAVVMAIVLGFGVLALGIVVAVLSQHVRH